MVIVEQRDYHVHTGTLPELVKLYEDEGIAIQQEVLGGFVGAFTTDAEAIAIANDTPFGLSAYFYSRDLGRTWRVAEALEYGIVGINTGFVSTEVAPFGGMKESGIGREGSSYGVDDWVELKYLAMGGIGEPI